MLKKCMLSRMVTLTPQQLFHGTLGTFSSPQIKKALSAYQLSREMDFGDSAG